MQNLYRFVCVTLWLLVVAVSARTQDLAMHRQSSYYTFIYTVRPDVVQPLYENIYDFKTSMLDTLVDVYPTDSVYRRALPVGHYMFVFARQGRLEWELHSVNAVNLKVLNNRRDLVLVLYDSLGRELTDARVYVGKKNIPYDAKTSTYRLASASRQGTLRVEYQHQASYFTILREFNNGVVARAGRKVRGLAPVKHFLSPYYYVKHTVSNLAYGNRLSPPGIYYRFNSLLGNVNMSGYVATNKPVYKTGDTVRLKAYIVSPHGRRFRKPVDLYLSENGNRDDRSDKKLAVVNPFHPGAYTFEFVLYDSLGLLRDHGYAIQLRRRHGHRSLPWGAFRFEDYVLQQNTYSARAEQAPPGKLSSLYLKGVDANNLPVYDAQVEILLRPVRVQQYFPKQVFVPDTLWYHTLVLDPVGETQVVLPDSVMPDVAVQYEAVVVFRNSSQERVEKVVSLSYNRRPFPVALLLQGDTLQVKAWDADNHPVLGSVRLETFTGVGTASVREVMLPYREKVNYAATLYRVHYADSAASLAPGDKAAELTFTARRTHDSLYVEAQNPRRIPFRYFLFRNSRLIASGKEAVRWKQRADPLATYTLSVQYTWGGNVYSEEHPFTFDTRELILEVEHPEQVYPGQQVPITITARDARGRPVRDTDLTAYAYTSSLRCRPRSACLTWERRPARVWSGIHLRWKAMTAS